MFFFQWQGRLYTNLLAIVHFIDTGLIDDWLCGSSVRSTKDLGLKKYLAEVPMRQPLTTTHSLMAVNDVCMYYVIVARNPCRDGTAKVSVYC